MDRLRAAYNAWLERTNPLAGLSVSRARSLYDAARAYGSPRLQYTYDEIELTDPVLLTCTERRASAIAGMGWKFRARAAADAALAQEQRDALQTFANDIENLTEALEHLDLAFFRGFAHVQPIWDGEKVQHIALLKSWNFLRDPDGTWYWNPECRETPHGLAAIGPDARLVTVTRRRAIDYPALSIHIRHALGERDWGRFVERYGIPPADITMAPSATEADRPRYENTADAAKDGRNIVLPNGASVTRAGDTRGVNPFLDFCEYQAKQILILATGGTLATLAEGDTGTLAGNAQENVWRQIVARDGGVISDALNRALFRPFLAMKFPNRPTCVDFELGADKTPSAEEVFNLAAKAKSAGYLIAQDELEEASGYTLEKDVQQPQNAPMFGLARARDAAPPLQNAKTALQNAPHNPDGQGEGRGAPALLGPFLSALKEDCKPLAAEVEELLKALESGGPRSVAAEKAKALLAKLPEMVPSDPALAPLLAEEMAKAFGGAWEESHAEARRGGEAEAAAAKTVVAAAEDREANGEFAPKGTGDKTGGKKDAGKKDGEDGNEGSSGTYTAEHRSKVGQDGDYRSLGLPSLRDITPDEPRGEGKTKIPDARKRIAAGETMKSPLGDELTIDKRTTDHWKRTKKTAAEIKERLQHLDEAEATITQPHEIWQGGGKHKGTSYIRVVKSPSGRYVINVAEMRDGVVSWHMNETHYDFWRKGKLLYVR